MCCTRLYSRFALLQFRSLPQDGRLLLAPDSSPAFGWTDRIGTGRAGFTEWRGAAFPKPVEEYHDEQIPGITAKLVHRIQAEPFNPVGTLIFLGAIVHTFLASKFMLIDHRLEHQYHALEEQEKDTSDNKELFRVRDGLPTVSGAVVSFSRRG